MDLQAQRDLQLLNEVQKDSGVSQRTLSKKLGIALGLTNLYLKRLAKKGCIKIATIPRSRIKYLLTPRGVSVKSRLTYQYMQYSLSYYRDMRERLRKVLSEVCLDGSKRLVIYGTGELAELAYLSVRETELILVAFVDGKADRTFLSHPRVPLEALSSCEFDVLLIAELEDPDKIRDRLIQAAVPTQKVRTLLPASEILVKAPTVSN